MGSAYDDYVYGNGSWAAMNAERTGVPIAAPTYSSEAEYLKATNNGMSEIGDGKWTNYSRPTVESGVGYGSVVEKYDPLAALKAAQLKSKMAGLDQQRTNSLSNLTAERAVIEPEYQKKKIGAATTAKQTARSFDEYMAQRGGGIAGNNKSGIAGQGTLINNLGYQGAKNTLDTAEAGAITANAQNVTGVNNNYESDRVAAEGDIESQYLQNYITRMNTDRAYKQAQDQFNANLGLQQSQFDYSKTRDSVGDTRYADETAYSQGRDALGDTRYADETQYNRTQAQMEWDFKQQGYSDDQAFRMATLAIEQQNANRLSSSSSKKGVDGGKYSDSTTASMKSKIDDALANGTSTDELLAGLQGDIDDGTAKLKNYDAVYLYEYIKSKVNSQYQTMDEVNRNRMSGGSF